MPVSDNKQLAASRASAANGKDPLLPKQPHSRRLHRAYRRAVEASTLSSPATRIRKEAILEVQPEENKTDYAPHTEPVSNRQPNPEPAVNSIDPK